MLAPSEFANTRGYLDSTTYGLPPKRTLRALAQAAEDWAAMASGELPGPTAFMSGKLKIEGDMPFAMSLGNLMQ